jgi:predicted ribosomally synthesized peptide with nif11-like leader
MSFETVNQFLQKVSEDTLLQEELTQVLDSAENDREAATELGAKHGYQFTSEELWQGIQNRQSEFQVSQNQEELSDEELEAVAGGASPTLLVPIITHFIPKPKW